MRMCADVIEPIAMVIITIDPTPIVFSEMERSVAARGIGRAARVFSA
jgi:hypothetical protein